MNQIVEAEPRRKVDWGERDQEDSCPRETDKARGAAAYDDVVRTASNNLRTVYSGGGIEIAT